jgi:hypothetical protein
VLAEAGSASDLQTIFTSKAVSRVFTLEFDPGYPTWGINVTDTIRMLHSRGMRTLTATGKDLPSASSQEALFRAGIDVVYTYDTENGITARTSIDKERGVTPP